MTHDEAWLIENLPLASRDSKMAENVERYARDYAEHMLTEYMLGELNILKKQIRGQVTKYDQC